MMSLLPDESVKNPSLTASFKAEVNHVEGTQNRLTTGDIDS